MSDELTEFDLIEIAERTRQWLRDHGCVCPCLDESLDPRGRSDRSYCVSGPHYDDCPAIDHLIPPEDFV